MSPHPQGAPLAPDGNIEVSPSPTPALTPTPITSDPLITATATPTAGGGLSTNTKTTIGIVVAVGIVALIGAGIGLWWCLRRKRRRARARVGGVDGVGSREGLMRERDGSVPLGKTPSGGDGDEGEPVGWVPQTGGGTGYGTEIRAYSEFEGSSSSQPAVEYHYGMRRDRPSDGGAGPGYGGGGLRDGGEGEDEGGLPGYGKSRAMAGAAGGNGGARGMYQRYESMGDEKMLIPEREEEEREGLV